MDAKTLGDMPASPFEHGLGGGTVSCRGITLRQHFAGLAMQGMLASGNFTFHTACGEGPVQAADLLLAALAKEST